MASDQSRNGLQIQKRVILSGTINGAIVAWDKNVAKFVNIENPSIPRLRIVDYPDEFRMLPRCRTPVFVFTDIVDDLDLPLSVISMTNPVFSVFLGN
jgi:hypothetical protein